MDLDLFDDIDDAPKKVRVGAKFQPKAKPRLPRKGTPLVPSSQKVVTNEQSHVAEKQSYPDDQSNSGVVNPSSEHGVSTCTTNSMVDSGPDIDVPVPEKNKDLQALFETSTREDADIMIELESLDILHDSSSVLENAFPSSETPAASNVPCDPVIQSVDDLGSLLHIPNVDSECQISVAEDVLTENEFIVVEPVHNQQDTVFTDDRVPDLDAETPEEHIQTGPKAPRKLASRRAKRSTKEGKTTASDQSSNPQEASTPSQTGTGGRVLRKRQNRDSSFHLVDEPEDDALVVERVGSDSEFQPTNEPPGEKEKPGRKRKKDNKKTDETAKKAPKKFSHSTKRRKVDKSLLENPDNIDVQKVSLTNLIRLAEYKERVAKKNEAATASQAPPPNQTTVNHPPAHDNNGFQDYDEGEDLAFEEGGNFDGEPIVMAEENSGFFNYQTFMNKTRRSKWTEQDTELFYEGIQQFGTDFSMIQQLFPGRTRRQVKLKYKKEELKHPVRLREALMNRSKGHSHFDTVIERLKQIAAEEKKNDKNDDESLNGVEEGDEDESEANNKEEEEEEAEAASAQVDHEQDVVEDKEEEVPEDEAIEATVTEEAYDSEDELFRWSQYKSEL